MVCIWRCNRWLVWHNRVGIWEVGTRTQKSPWRWSFCFQTIVGQRGAETTKRKRSRVLQENTETTFCERSSDSFSLQIHAIHEEQSWKWRPDEMDDKISDWWKKIGRIMDGLMSRTWPHSACYCSRGQCKKTCTQQCTSCTFSGRQQSCCSTMDRWDDTGSTQWGY